MNLPSLACRAALGLALVAALTSCSTLVRIDADVVPEVPLFHAQSVALQVSGFDLASTTVTTKSTQRELLDVVDAERQSGFSGVFTSLGSSVRAGLEGRLLAAQRFRLESFPQQQAPTSDILIELRPGQTTVTDVLVDTTATGATPEGTWTRDLWTGVTAVFVDNRTHAVLAQRSFQNWRHAEVKGLKARAQLVSVSELVRRAADDLAEQVSRAIHPWTTGWLTFLKEDKANSHVTAGLSQWSNGDRAGAVVAFESAWRLEGNATGALDAALVLFLQGERPRALALLDEALAVRANADLDATRARLQRIVDDDALVATIGLPPPRGPRP